VCEGGDGDDGGGDDGGGDDGGGDDDNSILVQFSCINVPA
jgi:hypothetical protein